MTEEEIKAEIRKFITWGHSREDVLIELAFKYAPLFSDLEEEWGSDHYEDACREYAKGVFLTATDLWRLVG